MLWTSGNRERLCRAPRGLAALVRGSLPLLALLVADRVLAADVSVTLDDVREGCRVRGHFEVAAPVEVVWAVLSDYDGIGEFVRSVRTSRLEKQPDGRELLRQDAVGGTFVFRRRMQVLLEIEEEPGVRIGFRDVLGKDFRHYVGQWSITGGPGGTQVVYELDAEPTSAITRALCRGPMRSAARDLLKQVRTEMMRRAAIGAADSTLSGKEPRP